MKTKLRAQVKSKFYYVFVGTATVAVVLGQLYVAEAWKPIDIVFCIRKYARSN